MHKPGTVRKLCDAQRKAGSRGQPRQKWYLTAFFRNRRGLERRQTKTRNEQSEYHRSLGQSGNPPWTAIADHLVCSDVPTRHAVRRVYLCHRYPVGTDQVRTWCCGYRAGQQGVKAVETGDGRSAKRLLAHVSRVPRACASPRRLCFQSGFDALRRLCRRASSLKRRGHQVVGF